MWIKVQDQKRKNALRTAFGTRDFSGGGVPPATLCKADAVNSEERGRGEEQVVWCRAACQCRVDRNLGEKGPLGKRAIRRRHFILYSNFRAGAGAKVEKKKREEAATFSGVNSLDHELGGQGKSKSKGRGGREISRA